MCRSTGWALQALVWSVLLGALALGAAGCVGSNTVAEVDADLVSDFPGYPAGLVDEVVSAHSKHGPVHVALAEGVPMFVGSASWSPTADFIEAVDGYCVFE